MNWEEKIEKLLSNPELTEQLKACTDVDKLQGLTKENGIELTREETLQAFEFFGGEKLEDDELNSIAGGTPPITPPPPQEPKCKTKK